MVIYQTNAGAMESATTTISMVTKLMNARRNQNLKVNVTYEKDMVTRHQNADPNHSIYLNKIVKEIFGWDYNT